RWGLLFLIDTGMSSDVNESLGAVLHISGHTATAVCPGGQKTELWSQKAPQDVGRAAACRESARASGMQRGEYTGRVLRWRQGGLKRRYRGFPFGIVDSLAYAVFDTWLVQVHDQR